MVPCEKDPVVELLLARASSSVQPPHQVLISLSLETSAAIHRVKSTPWRTGYKESLQKVTGICRERRGEGKTDAGDGACFFLGLQGDYGLQISSNTTTPAFLFSLASFFSFPHRNLDVLYHGINIRILNDFTRHDYTRDRNSLFRIPNRQAVAGSNRQGSFINSRPEYWTAQIGDF